MASPLTSPMTIPVGLLEELAEMFKVLGEAFESSCIRGASLSAWKSLGLGQERRVFMAFLCFSHVFSLQPGLRPLVF